MLSQAGRESARRYEYAQSLLRDKHRELQSLEIRHQREQIPTDEYLSCRRALLQAISELSHIEHDNSQCDPAHQINRGELDDRNPYPDRN
jgi:hypothetical protein